MTRSRDLYICSYLYIHNRDQAAPVVYSTSINSVVQVVRVRRTTPSADPPIPHADPMYLALKPNTRNDSQ